MEWFVTAENNRDKKQRENLQLILSKSNNDIKKVTIYKKHGYYIFSIENVGHLVNVHLDDKQFSDIVEKLKISNNKIEYWTENMESADCKCMIL